MQADSLPAEPQGKLGIYILQPHIFTHMVYFNHIYTYGLFQPYEGSDWNKCVCVCVCLCVNDLVEIKMRAILTNCF